MNHRTILVSLGLVAALGSSATTAHARNVIFFLGDGMGATTITASRVYEYGATGELHMESLARAARIKTYSFDAQTTDSAPSMSAYMTGVKMRNEVLSMTSDTIADTANCTDGNGAPVETILELAKTAGLAVGVVTTTMATHATPAATYSHICHRDLYERIAAQVTPGSAEYNPALADGVNVLFGGGRNNFTPAGRQGDDLDLLALFQTAGYEYVTTSDELNALPIGTTHVLGLFSDSSHLAYEFDRAATTQPSLSDMTDAALDVLEGASVDGYFLMVEGGRIDHALHATNAIRALTDTIAFDDAIATAMARVDLEETLVVVTADHDHVMMINGYPAIEHSILDIVRDADGNPELDADGFSYTTLGFGNGPNRSALRSSVDSVVALGADYRQESAVRLSSETHGSTDVILLADGVGSDGFRGTMDNTEVFEVLRAALEL